jgi:hypothetical protein
MQLDYHHNLTNSTYSTLFSSVTYEEETMTNVLRCKYFQAKSEKRLSRQLRSGTCAAFTFMVLYRNISTSEGKHKTEANIYIQEYPCRQA